MNCGDCLCYALRDGKMLVSELTDITVGTTIKELYDYIYTIFGPRYKPRTRIREICMIGSCEEYEHDVTRRSATLFLLKHGRPFITLYGERDGNKVETEKFNFLTLIISRNLASKYVKPFDPFMQKFENNTDKIFNTDRVCMKKIFKRIPITSYRFLIDFDCVDYIPRPHHYTEFLINRFTQTHENTCFQCDVCRSFKTLATLYKNHPYIRTNGIFGKFSIFKYIESEKMDPDVTTLLRNHQLCNKCRLSNDITSLQQKWEMKQHNHDRKERIDCQHNMCIRSGKRIIHVNTLSMYLGRPIK